MTRPSSTMGRSRERASDGGDAATDVAGPAPGRGNMANRARRAPAPAPGPSAPPAVVDTDAAFGWGDAAPTLGDVATEAIEGKGAGEPVDATVAARVGAQLDADVGGVRVHRDPHAQAASAALGARAFAHGADVFLGRGESPTDVGLMAHELTHVAQQGAAGQASPARKVEVGAADSPAEHEADAVARAVVGGAAPASRLVDAGMVTDGQMLRGSFLAALREAVTAAADAELGPEFSAVGCPYIDIYFQRYATRPSREVEAVLRRFAPDVRDVASAAAMIPIIVERVRAGVRHWRDTGAAPPEVAALEPAAATAAAAASPAQAAASAAEPGASATPAVPSPTPGSGAAMVARMGPAESLPDAVASRMSEVIGHDVSNVSVHTSPAAAAVASEQGANALAVGAHVAFAPGKYAPGTVEGDALLAHELAHTAQQRGVTDDQMARPLGDERKADEDEADEVAVTAGIAQSTGAPPKRKAGGFLRGGLSLQRCNVAASPPKDFAALPAKDKAAWLEATAQSGKDARGAVIVGAMRQLPPAEFVAVQGLCDFASVVDALGDWDAVELGALGPVTGSAAATLNKKRAGHVVHAINNYSAAQAELHVAHVVSTMYDDDVHDLAVEVANKNRLGRMLEFELVRKNLESRGISLDNYNDVGDGRSGVRRFFSGMGKRLWGMVSQGKDDDHYLKRPSGALGEASQALDIEETLPTSVGGALRLLDNTATFGMVGGVVGLGVNTVRGVGDLIDGDYEAAGADLTDAALVVTIHLGVKALSGPKPAPAPTPAAPPETPGLVGPEGPGQFTVPGFEGPLSAAEAKVGATVTRGLTVEAQAAVGRIVGRIGRDGLERVAGYMRQRDAAAFIAERGEAAVYALDEAKGDVTAARTKFPDRQLKAPDDGAPSATADTGEAAKVDPARGKRVGVAATSRLPSPVVEVLDEVGVDLKKADAIVARGVAPDSVAEIAIDYGTEGIDVLDGLTKARVDAKATAKILASAKATGTTSDVVTLTKDGLLEQPGGLAQFMTKLELEARKGGRGLTNELARAARRAREGHRVSLGGRKQVAGDPDSGQADVVDYTERASEQVKTVPSPNPMAVRDNIVKAVAQLSGKHGEVPPVGYRRTAVILIENPRNALHGVGREELRAGLAGFDLDVPSGVDIEISNGHPDGPFTFTRSDF